MFLLTRIRTHYKRIYIIGTTRRDEGLMCSLCDIKLDFKEVLSKDVNRFILLNTEPSGGPL
jgi:hypothetical protein